MRKGEAHKPETLAKIAAGTRGRKRTPEQIERMRLASLAAWARKRERDRAVAELANRKPEQ